MIQLIYLSTATSHLPADALDALCRQSSAANKAVEISGVLFSRDDRFLQVLEGPKEAVENTFLRIICDPRHRDLLLLSRRLITAREFGTWAMRHYDDADPHDEDVARIVALAQAAPASSQRALEDWRAGPQATTEAD